MDINFYCDESCHIQKDGNDIMALVTVYCSKARVKNINKDIRYIKESYGYKPTQELKWNKVSKCNLGLYQKVLDYILDKQYIRIRAVIAKDKSRLQLYRYNINYNQWYHTIYYNLIKHPISFLTDNYNFKLNCRLLIDEKDIYSPDNINKLSAYLENYFLHNHKVDGYAVRSYEHQLIQVADIFAGAITYRNRNITTSTAKLELCNIIEAKFGSLTDTTYYSKLKYNLFVWNAREL